MSKDNGKRDSVRKFIKTGIWAVGAGCIYVVWYRLTNIGIPCPFYMITGLKCPGCGISRMFLRLFSLDFYGAFQENPVVFVLLPLLGVLFLCHGIRYMRTGEKEWRRWENRLIWASVALLLIWGVIRNIGEGVLC